MSLLEKIPIKNDKYVSRIVEGQAVILEPESNRIKLLNKVASRIWECIDGQRTGKDILQIILDEYDVKEELAKEHLIKFLQELFDGDLIIFKNS